MIRLTKLNAEPLLLDPDLIKRVDVTPETVLTMVDGTRHVVKEGLLEVVEHARQHWAVLLATTGHVQAAVAQPRGDLLPLTKSLPGAQAATPFR